MAAQLKMSLSFYAAGNIYFANQCAVLRLSGRTDFTSAIPFDAALEIAQRELQNDQVLSYDSASLGSSEPSVFVGQVARLSLAVLQLAGFAGLKAQGWCQVPSDTSIAAFTCMDREIGQLAAELALSILTGRLESDRVRLTARFLEAGKPWARPLANVALACDIPISLVAGPSSPFLALGQGTKRRLFWKMKHFTPETSYLATRLSTSKHLTSRALREAGLPAPRNIIVDNSETAVRVAEKFGYPVVVKPAESDFGSGVSTENVSPEDVRSAFNNAAKYGRVLVEEQIVGDHHRLVIMHGRCLGVSRRLPARVVADGVSTISQLVEAVNQTRTEQLTSAGKKIKLDEVAHGVLKAQGMTPQSIPEAGVSVLLRWNSNQSSGGTAELVTDAAHPDVVKLALQAAALLGIDVAGVDYITPDITASPKTTKGAICEVNVTPGLVNDGNEDDLIGALLNPFFPAGDNGRIEVICCVKEQDFQPQFIEALASLLDTDATRSDQVYFWNESKKASLPQRTAAVLADPLASSALITCTSHEIKVAGLGVDQCSLALIEDCVPRDVANALLRIASRVVMPIALYHAVAQDPLLTEQKARIWLVGEAKETPKGDFAGWVRRIAPDKIEISQPCGTTLSFTQAPASGDAETLIAAGSVLGASTSTISKSLLLLDEKTA